MKRLVSTILISAMILNAAPLALAQNEESIAEEAEDARRSLQCKSQGEMDGRAVSTGNSFAGGLVGGTLLGLIGTGIAVLTQSTPEPPPGALMVVKGDATCRMIYAEAYRSAGKSKKQMSAFYGGLVGTVVIVTVIVATTEYR